MKNIKIGSLIILVLLSLLAKVNAQCDSVFFRNTATFINDVALIDSSKILCVGDNGLIIRSTEGGRHWENIKTYQNSILRAIQMTPDKTGYVVGDDRTILKTEDEGKSWFSINANIVSGSFNPNFSYRDLFFFNSSRGFIVGEWGKLIKTEDGGRSWKDTALVNGSGRFNSISFIGDSLGFICGNNTALLKTSDGGTSWQKIDLAFLGSSRTLNKVKFINTNTGFIIGDGGLCIRTTDGGNTWTTINTPTSATYFDIFFENPLHGFIIGSNAIINTTDGGSTWASGQNVPSQASGFFCIDSDPSHTKIIIAGGLTTGMLTGYNGRSIISTINSGSSYSILSANSTIPYHDAFFLNDSTGYIAGSSNKAFKTSDYGESWVPLQDLPVYYGGNPIQRILFLDSLNGFASTDIVSKTNDGGKTWVKLANPTIQPQYIAKQMCFFNSLVGLIMDNSTIYKTINGGNTWTNVLNVQSVVRDFTFTANGKGYAVATDGRLYFSLNYGDSWQLQNINSTDYLTSVYFYNNDLGFIGTSDNSMFKTIDGGVNWTKITSNIAGVQMRSFKFVSEKAGYLLAYNDNSAYSFICKTSNAGESWYIIKQIPVIASRFGGVKTMYTAGADGLIVKTDTLQKPGIPGYINGPAKACVNSQSYYVTGTMTGMNFNWSLTGGGSNMFGANKDTVGWSTPGLYTLSVSTTNACGTSPVRQTLVDVAVFQPVIAIKDSVLTSTEGLEYEWFLNGEAISTTDGGTTRSIIGHVSGFYTVRVKSSYGCTIVTPAVNFKATLIKTLCPDVITFIASNLSANTYQWQRDDSTGFLNISDNSFLVGTQNAFLQFRNTPSSWYGYRFRCITNVGSSDIYVLQYLNTWTGSAGGVWENASNWSCGKVPDTNTDVVINSGAVVINSNVVIRKLIINPSVNLTVQAGHSLTITH